MGTTVRGGISFDVEAVARQISEDARELERLRSEQFTVRQRLAAYRQLLTAHGITPPEGVGDAFLRRTGPTILDRAETVLKGHPEGLTVRSLYDALVMAGFLTASPHGCATLTTLLRRDSGRFARFRTPNAWVYSLQPDLEETALAE